MRFFAALLALAAAGPAAVSAVYVGCYPASALSNFPYNSYNSSDNYAGKCGNSCYPTHGQFLAVQGTQCYCGTSLPASSTAVPNSQCSTPCPGYTNQACGGSSVVSVYTAG